MLLAILDLPFVDVDEVVIAVNEIVNNGVTVILIPRTGEIFLCSADGLKAFFKKLV